MSVKTVFRCFYASILSLITLALLWTCMVKSYDLFFNQDSKVHVIQIATDQKHHYQLVHNQDKNNPQLFIVFNDQSYLAKISCQHYQDNLCKKDGVGKEFRQVLHADLQQIKQNTYIKNLTYLNTQTQQKFSYSFTDADLQQFYQSDLKTARNQLITLAIFAVFALFVCFRIFRNFKKFLHQ